MDAIFDVVLGVDDSEPALDDPGEQTAEEDRGREIDRQINPTAAAITSACATSRR
jgi:hypothetical protein